MASADTVRDSNAHGAIRETLHWPSDSCDAHTCNGPRTSQLMGPSVRVTRRHPCYFMRGLEGAMLNGHEAFRPFDGPSAGEPGPQWEATGD